MASALEELSNNTTAENPASFEQYYSAWKKDNGYHDLYLGNTNYDFSNNTGDDLISRINNLFTGQVTSAKRAYNNYLTTMQNKYTAQREDTAIQRQMADAKAAGLNPLAVIGGSVSGAHSSASAEFSKQSEQKQGKSGGLGSILSSALKILGMLAIK